MASRGTVGCYLRELNIDELAGPIPEYVTHLEPHDLKNFLCRTKAQISAPLPRSFPCQLRSFSFTILQKWFNIPLNMITTCVQNTPFWGIFQKISPGGETTPWPLATCERERKWNRNCFYDIPHKMFHLKFKLDFWEDFEIRGSIPGLAAPISVIGYLLLQLGIWPKDR